MTVITTRPGTARPEQRIVASLRQSDHQKTARLVDQIALTSGEPTYQVYQRIYGALLAFYDVDLTTYPRSNGESLLTIAERFDLLDKVYLLAHRELL